MSPTGFDVRAYLCHPQVIRPTDLDLQVMGALPDPALDTLTWLWAVEATTLARMRDVLVTPTHADSRVTAFLTTWSYEQHWLAQTLQAVLNANGRTPREPDDTIPGRVRRRWDDRVRPTVAAVATNLMGAEITGAHMVTGWLDTAVLTLAYRRLGAAEPALSELVAAVVRLKSRHTDFYAAEATTRLAGGITARRIARRAVARWRLPGSRYAGPTPARADLFPLLTDPAARPALEDIDGTAAAFPGLTGTRPVHHALVRHLPHPDRLAGTPDAPVDGARPVLRRAARGVVVGSAAAGSAPVAATGQEWPPRPRPGRAGRTGRRRTPWCSR